MALGLALAGALAVRTWLVLGGLRYNEYLMEGSEAYVGKDCSGGCVGSDSRSVQGGLNIGR